MVAARRTIWRHIALAAARNWARFLGHADLPVVLTVIGGAALFVVGNLLFKWAFYARMPLSHLAGLAALFAFAWPAKHIEPLWTLAGASAIMIAIAVWEHVSLVSLRSELASASRH